MNNEELDGKVAPASAKEYRIALAGNPNCGKTTLFNTYTGARQHVGNYPGVTVDRKEGFLNVGGTDITLVDIPGTYSLTAYSQEELVARDELSFGKVEAVIAIADASALERNMLLTVQMLEMGMPVVLACNMMDEARKAGIHIDMEKLARKLGSPCFPLIARTGEGAKEILQKAVDMAGKGRNEPLQLSYGRDIDEALLPLEKCISEEKILASQYHPHWTAIKLLEGDPQIRDAVKESRPDIAASILELCDKVEQHVRDTMHAACESLITDARYGFVRSVLNGVISQDAGKDRLAMTDKLDKVLTNTVMGPMIMLGVLYLMFLITFNLGAYPQGWIENLFEWFGELCTKHMEEGLARSLIVDGIIGGVGGIVSFTPLIAIMFALIAFIEDSGYMARVAYMMDRVFRAFGLHGASVMPLIVGGGIAGGCAIPGVMATRTLRSPKERLATMLTVPYMMCGAKVPIFLLFIGCFFPENPAGTLFIFTLLGWVFALVMSWIFRHTIIKGESTPFVMELPPYRLPTAFRMLLHCWERTWMYLKKAGTIILAISVVFWALMTFPQLPDDQEAKFDAQVEAVKAEMVKLADKESEAYKQLDEKVGDIENLRGEEKLKYSYAGRAGVAIEPFSKLFGFSWRTNISILAGIAAKEAVVSTLGTAYAMGKQDPEDAAPLGELLKNDKDFNKAVALSLLLFSLLYSPCFVTLAVIKSESGTWRWMFFSLIFNTCLGLAVAYVGYHIGLILWNV